MLAPWSQRRARTARGAIGSTSGAGDRYLVVNPFFHTAGFKSGSLALRHAGRHDPPAAGARRAGVHGVAHERITMLPGPPTVFQTICSTTPTSPRSTCRASASSVTGAAVVPVEDHPPDAASVLGIGAVVTGYGLTETTGTRHACAAPTTRRGRSPPTSGQPSPGVEVPRVDDDGELTSTAGRARRSCSVARLRRHGRLPRRPGA